MNISNMKNIVVLNNLPSNLVDEAIIVLKGNKKAKNLEYIKSENNIEMENKKINKSSNNANDYIIKEAENIINNYVSGLEKKSPKWKNNMKKLETRYKISVKINFALALMMIISFAISFM